MGENVRFEISGLGKFLIASIEWTDVRPVTRMYSDMGTKVKVQRESLPTAFERALKGFLSRMDELVAFQFRALDKGFPTLGAHVDTRTVSMEMFSHGRVVTKHLCTSLMRAGYSAGNIITRLSLRLYPARRRNHPSISTRPN